MHESAISGSVDMTRTRFVRSDADDEDEILTGSADYRYIGGDLSYQLKIELLLLIIKSLC